MSLDFGLNVGNGTRRDDQLLLDCARTVSFDFAVLKRLLVRFDEVLLVRTQSLHGLSNRRGLIDAMVMYSASKGALMAA